MKVGWADGKCHPLAHLFALFLERCRSTDGSIEGQVISLTVGRAGLDIAPAFAIGMGAGAPASSLTVQLVQVGIQVARPEGFSDLDFLSPIPPISIPYIKDALACRLTLVQIPLVLLRREV